MYIINTDQKTERFEQWSWTVRLNSGPCNLAIQDHPSKPFSFLFWSVLLFWYIFTYWFAFAWMTLQLKGGGLGREFICLIHINSDSSTSVAGDFLHLSLSFLTLFASVRMLSFCLCHETTVLFETSYFLDTRQSAMPPLRSWHAAAFSWMILVLYTPLFLFSAHWAMMACKKSNVLKIEILG